MSHLLAARAKMLWQVPLVQTGLEKMYLHVLLGVTLLGAGAQGAHPNDGEHLWRGHGSNALTDDSAPAGRRQPGVFAVTCQPMIMCSTAVVPVLR